MATLDVDIGRMVVSDNRSHVLVARYLGSCLAVSVFDRVAWVGGLIHCQLPLARLNQEEERENPHVFVDTGVTALLQTIFEMGATKRDLAVKVAGAAQVLEGEGLFRIGERNFTVLRKILWKNSIMLDAKDVGGTAPRTVSLFMDTGRTIVKSRGWSREL